MAAGKKGSDPLQRLSLVSLEVKDWTNPCRIAWREGLVHGWHAAKDTAAKAPGRGALVGYARVSTV